MRAHRWKVVSLIAIMVVTAIGAAGYKFTHQHPVTQQHLQGPFRVWQQSAHGVLKEIDVDPQSQFHREFVDWAQQLEGAPDFVTYAPIGYLVGGDKLRIMLGENIVVIQVHQTATGNAGQFTRKSDSADRTMLEKAKSLLAKSTELEPSNTEH
jgi:hypothetical protein